MTLLYTLLWQTISEHSKKTFFLGSFLTEVKSSGLQVCNVSEKEDFYKHFLGIFEILRDSFLSELFKKNICRGVFRSAVGRRLHSCNCNKKELYYIHFYGYFQKFWVQLFQHTLIKLSMTKFIEFLAIDYSSLCYYCNFPDEHCISTKNKE